MKITLNKPSVYECEGVMLLPGDNDVKNADKFLANKIVQADIKAGIISLEAPKPEPKIDTDAMIAIAQGDGRTTEVREAREALEAMGIKWDEAE